MSKLKKKNFNPNKLKTRAKRALKNYAGKKGKAIHRLNTLNKSVRLKSESLPTLTFFISA